MARKPKFLAIAAALVACTALTACETTGIGNTQTRGFLINEEMLKQIPVGSSQEQVSVVLGTPSTTATIDGDVWYYVTQRTNQPVAFMRPRVVDQQVLAVYFDNKRKVSRVANYGMQDGKVFDFISRTTPTSGVEETFLQRAIKAISF